MDSFPAVVVGGPPHSGKSVLTFSLSQELRRLGVEHYVLRACPDGEGDWANESDLRLVREIRVKGKWTSQWVDQVCRDISRRHLPLIVDMGGKPTPEQEYIFDHCTHAVLLTPDRSSRQVWQEMMVRHSLPLFADLTSLLDGTSTIAHYLPALEGTVVGLERGSHAAGPVFDELLQNLAELFRTDPVELRRRHMDMASVELVIDLDRLARTLGITDRQKHVIWQPHHLPALLDQLPARTPLGLYGRAPNWVYGAVAGHARPTTLEQFDVRLGWVRSRQLRVGTASADSPVHFEVTKGPDYSHLLVILPHSYVDYTELDDIVFPSIDQRVGLVFSGRIPLWLYTSFVYTYQEAPWLAMFHPRLGGNVVVWSQEPGRPIGSFFSG